MSMCAPCLVSMTTTPGFFAAPGRCRHHREHTKRKHQHRISTLTDHHCLASPCSRSARSLRGLRPRPPAGASSHCRNSISSAVRRFNVCRKVPSSKLENHPLVVSSVLPLTPDWPPEAPCHLAFRKSLPPFFAPSPRLGCRSQPASLLPRRQEGTRRRPNPSFRPAEIQKPDEATLKNPIRRTERRSFATAGRGAEGKFEDADERADEARGPTST